MAKSRTLGVFVPGFFGILPQDKINSVLGFNFPIREKKLVTAMTDIQFIAWNIWAAQSIAAFALGDAGYERSFSYNMPDSNCITWTEDAVRKARIISLFPL